MKTIITCQEDLRCTIEQLEKQRREEGEQLKASFHQTMEDLKPVNIIKNTLHDIGGDSEIKRDVIKAAFGLAIGLIVKKLLVASSANPLRVIVANILEIAVAGYIAKNPEKFRALAVKAIKLIMMFREYRNRKRLQPQTITITSRVERVE